MAIAMDQLLKMSTKELRELRQNVDVALSKKRDADIETAREEVRKKADELGIDFEELLGKKRKTRAPRPPKFRNPDNSLETWTGMGRQPKWFGKQLEAGRTKEDMLIDKK